MNKIWVKKMFVIPAIIIAWIIVSGLSGCSNKNDSSDRTQKPNIVFIVIDTLRADRLGMYGYEHRTSDVMDTIAAEGVVFKQTFSPAPWTQPAMASLFSSTYPGVHKVIDYGLADRMRKGNEKKIAVFDDRFITVAEALQKAGYETAGFNANILLSKEYGFAQGFDLYADRSVRRKNLRADTLNAEAVNWLRQRKSEKPFFLYMHYMDVHGSYYARDEYVARYVEPLRQMKNKTLLTAAEKKAMGYINSGIAKKNAEKYPDLAKYREFWSALYDAGIAEMDFHIGSLVKELKSLGLWKDCYVVITADHGESLCERGFWSHGLSLYQTELHVPLILRWPGHIPPGLQVNNNTQLIDFMPTLVNQLSLNPVEGMQGRSLCGDIEGKKPETPIFAFAEAVKQGPPQFAAYLNQWKLLMKMDYRTRKFVPEYYNIIDDPDETTNLFKQHPQKVGQLINAIQDQINENRKLGQKTEVNPSIMKPEDYETLKSLGYVK